MLSREVEERVRQHLRLAKGLLETTVLTPESTEFEERNSLSRAYYALFHASCALMLSNGLEPSKSHGGLRVQIQRWLGKSFGRFLGDLYELRRSSDYEASWTPVRHVSNARLKSARANFFWACLDTEKKLKRLI
jgi:uncharacterized protein (UPF0332 family)